MKPPLRVRAFCWTLVVVSTANMAFAYAHPHVIWPKFEFISGPFAIGLAMLVYWRASRDRPE